MFGLSLHAVVIYDIMNCEIIVFEQVVKQIFLLLVEIKSLKVKLIKVDEMLLVVLKDKAIRHYCVEIS